MTMLPKAMFFAFFHYFLVFWFFRDNRFFVICRAHQPFFLSVLVFAGGDPLQVRGLQVVLTHRAGSTRLPLMIQFAQCHFIVGRQPQAALTARAGGVVPCDQARTT